MYLAAVSHFKPLLQVFNLKKTWVAVPRPTAELLLQVAVEAASLPNTVCVCAHVFLKDLCEKSSHPSDCLYVIKSDLEREEH